MRVSSAAWQLPQLDPRGAREAFGHEVQKLNQRHGKSWNENHRRTLTSWSRTARAVDGEAVPKSASSPALSAAGLVPSVRSWAKSSEDLQAMAALKLADVMREHSTMLEALPEFNQRFAEESVRRFKTLSQGHASVACDRVRSEPSMETLEIRCPLCRVHHGVDVPCML